MPKFDLKTAIFQAFVLISTGGFTYHFLSKDVKEKPNVTIVEKKQEEQKEPQKQIQEQEIIGKYEGVFCVSHYYTVLEDFFSRWSSTYKKVGGIRACKLYGTRGGFYEAVRCEGHGITSNNQMCSYRTIDTSKKYSKCKDNPTNSRGSTSSGEEPKVGRTIAVDRKKIPFGSAVKLEFVNKDRSFCTTEQCKEWNGWYLASDTGGGVRGKEIDLYAGFGTDRGKEGKAYSIAQGLPRRAKVYTIQQSKNVEAVLEQGRPAIYEKADSYEKRMIGSLNHKNLESITSYFSE